MALSFASLHAEKTDCSMALYADSCWNQPSAHQQDHARCEKILCCHHHTVVDSTLTASQVCSRRRHEGTRDSCFAAQCAPHFPYAPPDIHACVLRFTRAEKAPLEIGIHFFFRKHCGKIHKLCRLTFRRASSSCSLVVQLDMKVRSPCSCPGADDIFGLRKFSF